MRRTDAENAFERRPLSWKYRRNTVFAQDLVIGEGGIGGKYNK